MLDWASAVTDETSLQLKHISTARSADMSLPNPTMFGPDSDRSGFATFRQVSMRH